MNSLRMNSLGMNRLRTVAVLACLLAAGACSDGAPPLATAPSVADQAESVVRVGDVSIRASVVQTSALNPAVARQYGIQRDDNTVMLLVAVRQGADASAAALPAQVTATATDLRGRRRDIAMRELRSGELLDYVGSMETSLPDTLRFDVRVVREGGAVSTLQIVRDFFPQ